MTIPELNNLLVEHDLDSRVDILLEGIHFNLDVKQFFYDKNKLLLTYNLDGSA